MADRLATTIHDVLNPLTGARQSIRWQGEGVAMAATWPHGAGRDVDGAHLWLLPALYDADAHMPLVEFGFRHADMQCALAGGVAQMNVAIPWQLIRDLDIQSLAADIFRAGLPAIIPLLSISPDADSAAFPAWLKAHRGIYTEIFPALCKLYSTDPNLEQNIEAVWDAGLKPMIWNACDEDLAKIVERAGDRPIHLRHATSSAMVELMRRAANATLQTSPHFLLPLAPAKAEALYVLPALPPEAVSRTLADVFLAQVDMIVTDHNAPPFSGPAGPGLQSQQHFLSTLLTMAENFAWPLDAVWHKATRAPADIFGVSAPAAMLLVDPGLYETVTNWPGQSADRAPFETLRLKGRVLAMMSANEVALV
jgi:dihydroorotase-like cyclic amidohydrolase